MNEIKKNILILLISYSGMVYTMDMVQQRGGEGNLEQSLADLESERCLLEGRLYFYGEGAIEQDYKRAFECFGEAAKKKDVRVRSEACYLLGTMYYRGNYVERDYDRSLLWFFRVVQESDISDIEEIVVCAQYGLGLVYYRIKHDYEKAREYLEKATVQDENKEAQAAAWYYLGRLYHNGEGVAQDYEKAREYYEKATAQDVNKQAQAAAWYYLGRLYHYGKGVVRNYVKAREYYEKVAEQDADRELQWIALGNLGDLYANGWGVKKDHKKAGEYYQEMRKRW